jgi:hypothetical protein
VATRFDKLAANDLAFIQLASIRLWLRVDESTPLVFPTAALAYATDLPGISEGPPVLVAGRPCASRQQRRNEGFVDPRVMAERGFPCTTHMGSLPCTR